MNSVKTIFAIGICSVLVIINVAIAVWGILLYANVGHYPFEQLDSYQSFIIGFYSSEGFLSIIGIGALLFQQKNKQ